MTVNRSVHQAERPCRQRPAAVGPLETDGRGGVPAMTAESQQRWLDISQTGGVTVVRYTGPMPKRPPIPGAR